MKDRGYSNGFSMAGLPYDFRKFHLTNSNFKDKFELLVEMLYRNTGKKVIVVAHSLGNLNVLNILNKENQVNSKIKRYIGMVPPFYGATKAVEFFSTGSTEFRIKLFLSEYIDISSQAQKFYGTFTPVSYALTLRPKLHELTNLDKYKEFIVAIKERIDLEKKCGILSKEYNKTCTIDFVRNNSKNFKKFFPFFPQFDSDLCINLREKIISKLQTEDFLSKKNKSRVDIFENLPSYDGCEIRIFDFLRCPFMKIIKGNPTEKNFTLDDFNKICFEDFNDSNDSDLIFNHNCKYKNNSKNCLFNFLKNYTNFEAETLFKPKDQDYKDFPKSLILNKTEYERVLEIMINNTWEKESIEELDSPKVPTSILYSSYLDTKTNYIYRPDGHNKELDHQDINYFGGDGTVATYSSLIPAMKWIYDNNINSKT